MIADTLANTTRAAHDVGLAAWLGGAMFGKFALNPSLEKISSREPRGCVAARRLRRTGPLAHPSTASELAAPGTDD
jgi:hypothetical protein